MTDYPILFGWRDAVEGDGFIAGVALEGRALMHVEADGYVWIEGVNPGGFAGTGLNPAEALDDFRRSYQGVLYDLATDAVDLQQFEREVQAFFDNCSETVLSAWEEASILYNGKTAFLPRGKHGHRRNVEIEIGHVRTLARALDVSDCAQRQIEQLR